MQTGGSSRVLVVDDDPIVAHFVARVVKTVAEPVVVGTGTKKIPLSLKATSCGDQIREPARGF